MMMKDDDDDEDDNDDDGNDVHLFSSFSFLFCRSLVPLFPFFYHLSSIYNP